MLNSFVKHITYPIFAKKEGLNSVLNELELLEKSERWDKEKLYEIRFYRLKKLLIHAFENCPFYENRFNEAGFNPYNFEEVDDLKNLPILTKNDIRNNIDSIVAKNFKSDELHYSETGGTSGVKMKFYRNNSCLPAKEAAIHRFEKWTGWDFGQRMSIVWPAKQDYLCSNSIKSRISNEFYKRQIFLPAASLDEKIIADYITTVQKKKPMLIRAFTSPLIEVADYIINRKIEIDVVKAIITTGEPLYPYQRNKLSEAFHCEVFNSYRTREAGPIAQECEYHEGMHINAELLYLEVDQSCCDENDKNNSGEIIITDLINYGMPLIRYQIGDLGNLSENSCKCGRSLPLLKELNGRTGDMLITPDGNKIPAACLVLYLVDEAPGLLGQVQIIQDKKDHLIIRMTKDPAPTTQIKKYQKQKINEIFGTAMRVSFEEVDHIPREESGKYVFTKYMVTN